MAAAKGSVGAVDVQIESHFSNYLIDGKFLLTALEFHYELLERGISCRILEDFFSNPKNFYEFELNQPNFLSNSRMSLSTLDSADLRTGSENQNSLEDQMKVFEFELRKKNEEIRDLKERLTSATIGAKGLEPTASPTPTNSECGNFLDADPPSNTELRALRFLINEHLLNNGYKMSAVQFAEECEVVDQQDLDNWDDVGLTCERAPDLLCLLRVSWLLPRNVSLRRSSVPRVVQSSRTSVPFTPSTKIGTIGNLLVADVETQTDPSVEPLLNELEAGKTALSALKCNFEATKAELEVSRQQIGELRGKVTRIEAENLSLAQESTYWRNQLLCLKREYPLLVGSTVKTSKSSAPSESTTIVKSAESVIEDGNLKAEKSFEKNDKEEASSSTMRSLSPPMEPSAEESTSVLRKCIINQPQFTRHCASEFVRCASELLPPTEPEDIPLEACRLADNLDEIIITIGSQIEDILKHLPDEKKALALPLLVQAICLHPDGSVRDKLLRALFNLFTDSPEAETSLLEMKRTVVILRQCRELAACLGPSRIECELLPQIWSQLNERPSIPLRKLLLSACGVIAPATPSRLRSSLLFSILLQSLEDERTEAVRAVALRSLAGLVVLMEDRDKLPNLVTFFDSALLADWSHPPLATSPLPCPRPHGVGSAGYVGTCSCALSAACNWLLPTIAQWCLEVDSFNNLLLSPWLERLKCHCFAVSTSNSRLKISSTPESSLHLKASFSPDELFRIMTVLNRLVPFAFASILQSLAFIHPDGEDSNELVLEVVNETDGDGNEEEHPEEGVEDKISSVAMNHCDRLFSPRYILGKRRCERLLESFNHLLSGEKATQRRLKRLRVQKPTLLNEEDEDEKIAETEEDLESTEPELITAVAGLKNEWPAMDELRDQHLLCIAQMMRAISPRPTFSFTIEATENTATHEYLEQDPISPQEFVALMQVQLDVNYCAPWGLPPTSIILLLCKELCFYIALFGKTFGAAAVRSHLGEPFHALLMERSTQGYFEFNLKALASGVFAGYCCLLAATKAKSEFNKVKTLIANAIFLHSRDFCSLHGVRAAIMALCHSEDAILVAQEVILPALQSCASCADPVVRRTASKIFYTLVAYLADAVDFDITSTSSMTVNSTDLAPLPLSKQQNKPIPYIPATLGLLEECWQLANQLARDDYTSIGAVGFSDPSSAVGAELPLIDEHSADWSCIAVALGPLFCLYSRMLRSSSHVTDSDLKERRNLSENGRIADQVLALIERLMAMVSVEDQPTLDSSAVHFLIQRQHWETLVCGLLQVVNRLFPTCSEEFCNAKILPWLYRLTEINNMIPDMEQRTRLGQRLISVFSNAAFRLGTEDSMMAWVLPGLDRLRLDFVEANEKSSAAELEQLSSDLRQRLSNHTGSPPVPTIVATDTTKNRLRQKFANLLNSAGDSQITHSKIFPFAKHS